MVPGAALAEAREIARGLDEGLTDLLDGVRAVREAFDPVVVKSAGAALPADGDLAFWAVELAARLAVIGPVLPEGAAATRAAVAKAQGAIAAFLERDQVPGSGDAGSVGRVIRQVIQKGAVRVVKADGEAAVDLAEDAEEERFVLGVVLEPNDEEAGLAPDTQGEIYSEAEVRKAAHWFMEFGRAIGFQHAFLIPGKVRILESYVAPVAFDLTDPGGEVVHVRRGTWLLGLRILDDDLWALIRSGSQTGLSIDGTEVREAIG